MIIIVTQFLNLKHYDLGSQDTLIGGGRYDGLIKILGGPDIPGVGMGRRSWENYNVNGMILLIKQKTVSI